MNRVAPHLTSLAALAVLLAATPRIADANGRPERPTKDVASPAAEPFPPGQRALRFDGIDDFVTFGQAASLGCPTFTIEVWFKREGPGQTASSGFGGVVAVPLLTKGRAQVDGDERDQNYFLGIRGSDSVLVADFEEGSGQIEPGLNHPIAGITPIQRDVWYHAAASFDGSRWRLMLNGVIERDTTLGSGRLPQSASTQHAAVGSALNSSGVAVGYFEGVLEEPRVWDVGRGPQGVRDSLLLELPAVPGLVGRWGLNEGTGTMALASPDEAPAGALVNGPVWVEDSPFISPPDLPPPNLAPEAPALVAPAEGSTVYSTSPSLEVLVGDPDAEPLTVTFYGRRAGGTPGPDFTLIGLPDTQYYTSALNGGASEMFQTQTRWIVEQMAARNIVDVVHLGDCVENGDNGGDPIEWMRADTAMKIIEDPLATLLASGLPYGMCVGNHDQTPTGDASGTTTLYNQYFGSDRFTGRPYYGGHYGSNNDNQFHTFSASGLDFIVVCLEYDESPDAEVLQWAHDLIAAHPDRRAIVASHYIIRGGNPGVFGPQGQAIYDALKDLPNLSLMLCAHILAEGRRQDTYEGRTVHTLLSNYQHRENGGDGWLRIYEFSPANNVIRARTYSPTLDLYEAGADSSSQFTIPFDMSASTPFRVLGTLSNVASGSIASLSWPGLAAGGTYEWYAVVADGEHTVTGPSGLFTAAEDTPPTVTLTSPNGGESWVAGSTQQVTWTASDDLAITGVDLAYSTDGGANYPYAIASDLTNTGAFSWIAPATVDSTVRVRVTVRDGAGHIAADASDANFEIAGSGTTNLIVNSGFETDLSGWAPFGDATLSRVTGGHSGSYALEIDSPSSALFGIDDVPDWVGTTTARNAIYRFTAWVRADTSQSKVRIRVDEFLGGVQQGTTATSPEIKLTTSWQQLKLDYTVRATGSRLSLRVTETPNNGVKAFLVDDVSILLTRTPALASQPAGPGADDPGASVSGPIAFSATLRPNPVRVGGMLLLSTTREGPARVTVFDLAGRRVAMPLDTQSLAPGRHEVAIAPSLAAGLYFFRVEAREGSLRGRFAVVR